jgi:DNA polymerase-3 subunit gamma/tau
MLTGEAFNAFLKTLEEPPAHVVFVMATTEPHRVLPTILSRCQRFDFHRVGLPYIEANIRAIARREKADIDDKAVGMLARAADGSVRDSLTMLDQAIAYADGKITPEIVTEILGGIDFDLVARLTDAFIGNDVAGALSLIEDVVAEGKDLRQLLVTLIGHYRNLLLLSVDRRAEESLALAEQEVDKTAEQARALPAERILQTLELLAEADREIRFASQPRLLVELAAIRSCRGPAAQPVAAAPASRREQPPKSKVKPAEPAPRKRPQAEGSPQPAAAAKTTPSLEEIQQRWDEVIADLRKEKKTSVAAFVLQVKLADLDGDVLTLEFQHPFRYNQMARDEKRQQVLTQSIERVLGTKVKLRCTCAAAEGDSGRSAPPKAIEDLMSIFPGSELEQ